MLDWASSNLVGTLKELFALGKGGTHYTKRDGNDLKFKDPNNAAERTLTQLLITESAYAESNGEDSYTGSTTYQQKVRRTFTPVELAYFEITYSLLLSANDEKVSFKTRVQIDDTTTKKETIGPTGGKYADGKWQARAGHFVVQLSAAAHNIDLDYGTTDAGKTVYIKEAVVTVRRSSG